MRALATVFRAALCLAAAAPAAAQPHLFRVDCPGEAYVARWDSEAPDPGASYFRRATGTLNMNCVVDDFHPRRDAALPVRLCRDPGALVDGFPPALIVLGLTQCG
ncbi:hypothetical protein [Methylocella sp.]|uniref:hypothetical protein n=1 Tax=Methylocella sp. TaxID=1978226 RepID=UPI0037833868